MSQSRPTNWWSRLIDDRQSSLQEIKKSSDRSLIERLLEIQSYSSTTLRSFEWAHTATCLRVARSSNYEAGNGSELNLQEVTVDILHPDSIYVAVSYCNKASPSEPKMNKQYKILRRGGREPEPSQVRAYVLNRVIRFSNQHSIANFWIDDDCLGHTNRIAALHGMDMVYRRATRCVGLLTATLMTEAEAQLLDLFLQGEFVMFQGEHNKVVLSPHIEPGQIHQLCHLLQRIFSDQWWDRCWVFQEAYCGGSKMTLLMPHQTKSHHFQRFRHLERLDHDVQFRLRTLQEQTTLFSLALDQVHQRYPLARWSALKRTLGKGRRYDMIHEHMATRRAHFSKAPMSALIVADTYRCDLFDKADLPAIVANCCDYTRRIDVPLQVRERLSLGLVIIALFLLNGDFLKVNSKTKPRSAKRVCEILCDMSFRQTVTLESRNRLTVLKRRRWPRVELCPDFIKTWGHIWVVDQSVRVRKSRLMFSPDIEKSTLLTQSEKSCLEQLAIKLCPKYRLLSSHLRSLLRELSVAVREVSQRRRWMLLMAQEVCRAIRRGIPLLLGRPSNEKRYRAIFVSPLRSISQPITVLTSWEAGQMIEETQDVRAIEKYMSFRAQSKALHPLGDDVWFIKDWVNGLCFFHKLPQQEIFMPWPDFLQ